jgi:hypothetical protein
MSTGFDDDWGTTTGGGDPLEFAPHQAINGGDDCGYFINGRYVGKIDDALTPKVDTQALDFWEDSECVSLAWNENRVKMAVNRPNGGEENQSGIYTWNGFSPSWEGDPIEVKGKLGALYTKNGIDFVWWQEIGDTECFTFGYIEGTQLKPLKKCKGTLPLFYQVGEYKGHIAWMSDGLVYLWGSADPDAPTKFFQYTSAKYLPN